jgi:hypothetical protein
MPEQKPTKPSQFTESFQFIQSLFHEEESAREKLQRYSSRLAIFLKWGAVAAILVGFTTLMVLFQLEAITVTEEGIWLPRR